MSSEELVAYLAQHYTENFDDEVKLTNTQFDIDWKPEYYFFATPTEQLQLNSKLDKPWAGRAETSIHYRSDGHILRTLA